MEHYNKEKHHDLVLEHIKQAALSGLELDIYSRCDNYGNGLTELVINETDSILMKSKEYQEIFDEVFVDADYYRTMIDYITQLQNDFFTGVRCRQGTSVDPRTSSRMLRGLKNYIRQRHERK